MVDKNFVCGPDSSGYPQRRKAEEHGDIGQKKKSDSSRSVARPPQMHNTLGVQDKLYPLAETVSFRNVCPLKMQHTIANTGDEISIQECVFEKYFGIAFVGAIVGHAVIQGVTDIKKA